MPIHLPLPDDKKLKLTYRLEPGCLGPKGGDYIEGFCQFASKKVEALDADYILWNIIPRFDKHLTEMAYSVSDKHLSDKQADQYLRIFDKTLEEFEDNIQNECIALITQYMDQQ